LQSSFEKLENSVGVELRFSGQGEDQERLERRFTLPCNGYFENAVNSLVKARCVALPALMAPREVYASSGVPPAQTHAEGKEHVPVAVSSGKVTRAMPITAIQ
jgi:hypothetical protein